MSSSSRPDPADQRIGRYLRLPGDRHDRLGGPDLARRPPGRPEKVPQAQHGGREPHDRRAAAAEQPRPGGECGYRRGRGSDRDQVGADIAHRGELPTAVIAPHLAAEPGRIQAGLVQAGTDEHVDHRVTVAQCDDLVAVAIIEQAQCRRPPRLGAQHSSSVSAREGHSAAGSLGSLAPAAPVPSDEPDSGLWCCLVPSPAPHHMSRRRRGGTLPVPSRRPIRWPAGGPAPGTWR